MSAQSESVRRLSVLDIAKLHADGVRIATITQTHSSATVAACENESFGVGMMTAPAGNRACRSARVPSLEPASTAITRSGARVCAASAAMVAGRYWAPFLATSTAVTYGIPSRR